MPKEIKNIKNKEIIIYNKFSFSYHDIYWPNIYNLIPN